MLLLLLLACCWFVVGATAATGPSVDNADGASISDFGTTSNTVSVHFQVQQLLKEPFELLDEFDDDSKNRHSSQLETILRIRIGTGPLPNAEAIARIQIDDKVVGSTPILKNAAMYDVAAKMGIHIIRVEIVQNDADVLGSNQLTVPVGCCAEKVKFPSSTPKLHLPLLQAVQTFRNQSSLSVLVVDADHCKNDIQGSSLQFLQSVSNVSPSLLECIDLQNGSGDVLLSLAKLMPHKEHAFDIVHLDVNFDSPQTSITIITLAWKFVARGGFLSLFSSMNRNAGDDVIALRPASTVDVFMDIWNSEMITLYHDSLQWPVLLQKINFHSTLSQ